MKKQILLFVAFTFLLWEVPLQANEFRAGVIQITQLTATTVEAKVALVVDIHADVTDLTLCWGDGACSSFPVLTPVVNDDWGIKTYEFTAQHSYPQVNTFTVFIEKCCYDDDLISMDNPEITDFYIETMIVLQSGELNTTPDFDQGHLTAGMTDSIQGIHGAVTDPEGDTYSATLCEPLNALDFLWPDEFFPVGSDLFISEMDGSLGWVVPVFEGFYVAQTCMEEFRDGTLISRTQRLTCFMIGDYTSAVGSLGDIGWSIYPNPVVNGQLVVDPGAAGFAPKAEVALFNSFQQAVYNTTIDQRNQQLEIQTGHLPEGYYYLWVQSGEAIWYQPVIVH